MAEVNLIDNIPSIVSTIVAILAFWNAYRANKNTELVQEKMSERLREEQNRIDTRVAIIESKTSERAHLDRTYERKVFLREKYEILGELSTIVFGEAYSYTELPIEEFMDIGSYDHHVNGNKMTISSILYFKELIGPTNDLRESIQVMQNTFLKAHRIHSDQLQHKVAPRIKSIIQLRALRDPELKEKQKEFFKQKQLWIDIYADNADKYTNIDK